VPNKILLIILCRI